MKAYLWTRKLNKVMQDLSWICICKQKTFSPVKVSLINSSQTDKDLLVPVKTSKPKFFFFYFGNNLFDISLFYGSKSGSHFALNLHKFGVAHLEELEVNQWISLDIHWLSSQSDRTKNTIFRFSIY